MNPKEILSFFAKKFGIENDRNELPKKIMYINPDTGETIHIKNPARVRGNDKKFYRCQDSDTGQIYNVYSARLRHYSKNDISIPEHSKDIFFLASEKSKKMEYDFFVQVAKEAIRVLEEKPTKDAAVYIGIFEVDSDGKWTPTQRKDEFVEEDVRKNIIGPINLYRLNRTDSSEEEK